MDEHLFEPRAGLRGAQRGPCGPNAGFTPAADATRGFARFVRFVELHADAASERYSSASNRTNVRA